MNLTQLIAYYQNLLIIQYSRMPRAKAHIGQLVKPLLLDLIPTAIQNAFDINTAVGKQLDVIGKYVGVSRNGYTPAGAITLNDDDYRIVLRLALIKNTQGSSLATIQSLLASNFGKKIIVADNQTMQLNYRISDDLGSSNLLDFLTYGKFLPQPMGVQVSVTVVPASANNFFGMRTYLLPGYNVSPINNYPFYQTTFPFLSYGGVINV